MIGDELRFRYVEEQRGEAGVETFLADLYDIT